MQKLLRLRLYLFVYFYFAYFYFILLIFLHLFISIKKIVCLPLFPLPEETDKKKILLKLMSKSALSVLSNRAFVILGFQFKSLIHIVYFYICINKII